MVEQEPGPPGVLGSVEICLPNSEAAPKADLCLSFLLVMILSKGNEYTVTMRDSGFDCSCIAFRKCKHIKEVEKRIVGEN